MMEDYSLISLVLHLLCFTCVYLQEQSSNKTSQNIFQRNLSNQLPELNQTSGVLNSSWTKMKTDGDTPGNQSTLQSLLNNRNDSVANVDILQKSNFTKKSINELLPKAWQKFCSTEYKFVSGEGLYFESKWAVYVTCDLKKDDHWSVQDYRKWIVNNEKAVLAEFPSTKESSLLFAFDFKCKDRAAKLSFPWPIRAKYLWYVSADNCSIVDHFLEFMETFDVPDTLKVFEVKNCLKVNRESQLFKVMNNFEKQSRQYDCAGELLERYVNINISLTFAEEAKNVTINPFDKSIMAALKTGKLPKKQNKQQARPKFKQVHQQAKQPPFENKAKNGGIKNDLPPFLQGDSKLSKIPKVSSNISQEERDFINKIAQVNRENVQIQHKCNFKYLRYFDISYSHNVPNHHSQFLTERNRFPELEFYNMSHSKLYKVPIQFLEWRRYFPKMRYMDLSHNRIKHFSTFGDNGLESDPPGILDLRYNNITTLTRDELKTLRFQGRTVWVDIRENPFVCDCKMNYFVKKSKNVSFEVFNKYEYLRDIKCSAPADLKGTIIASLQTDFCDYTELEIFIGPLVILSCFTVFLVAIFVLSLRYRKEIVILAFTRLNISLPCRKIMNNADKAYDAFIAYSEQDGAWVFNTLLPRLEMPQENNGPGLKLCIHHRDFPVGGCIADNILDKVKDSRHTVLILSNNFLRSHWCKYEFKAAFTQSLMEKKQHLIMVILEALDKDLIDPSLKRCLKTFTYVEIDDRLFWDKIIYSLSDSGKRRDVDINCNKEDVGKNGKINGNIKRENSERLERPIVGENSPGLQRHVNIVQDSPGLQRHEYIMQDSPRVERHAHYNPGHNTEVLNRPIIVENNSPKLQRKLDAGENSPIINRHMNAHAQGHSHNLIKKAIIEVAKIQHMKEQNVNVDDEAPVLYKQKKTGNKSPRRVRSRRQSRVWVVNEDLNINVDINPGPVVKFVKQEDEIDVSDEDLEVPDQQDGVWEI